MQGKERGLGEQSRRHQSGREPHGRQRPNALGKQDDVERPVGPVEQRGAEQIEDGAEQSEHEIAQRRDQRLRLSAQADQRDRGEGQQFQRDIEIEQVAADEKDGQGRPDRLKHDPEGAAARCASAPVLRAWRNWRAR